MMMIEDFTKLFFNSEIAQNFRYLMGFQILFLDFSCIMPRGFMYNGSQSQRFHMYVRSLRTAVHGAMLEQEKEAKTYLVRDAP
jgi:hypothetical protein